MTGILKKGGFVVKLAPRVNEDMSLTEGIQSIIKELGTGRVDGVDYDTAWTARLASRYPGHGFERALDWIRHNQNSDGSWGGPVRHYHDRFISTLAAIVALREVGDGKRDERRVKRGENALWKIVGGLGRDDSDTVGFPLLSVSLAAEARALGMDVPQPPVRFAGPYQRKVNALLKQTVRNWRGSSLSFSLEGLRGIIGGNDDLLGENSSVAISPSATAAYLLAVEDHDALSYLRQLGGQDSGSVPALAIIDVFEIVWSLIHLSLVGAVKPDDPGVRRALDWLWSIWNPERGVSYSSFFGVTDVDDTAACYTILRWGGYPVSADVFGYFEAEEHFHCYHEETNPSVSAHVRLLAALRGCSDHPHYARWTSKVVSALQRFDENGSFWWDKWHSSPYYATGVAVRALKGLGEVPDQMSEVRLKWILRTRNDDGGWGYHGLSTPEETAYCLEALLWWDRTVERIDGEILDAAARYLSGHVWDASYTPLWIGKSLYTPHNAVRAAIVGALYGYIQQRNQVKSLSVGAPV